MSQEIINVGVLPNDGSGDPVRVAFQKINNNFTQVFDGNTFSQVFGPEGSVQFKQVNSFQAIAVKGNITLVTGYPSRFYTTTDYNDYIEQTAPTSNTIYDIISANGNFYGVGQGGTVVTSSDGAVWANAIQVGVPDTLRSIAYDTSNALFVTVGDNGRILSSPNGANWTLRTSGVSDHLHGVTFANALGFVVVGANGTALYSTNATTWYAANSTVSEDLYAINYNGVIFTAVGANGTIISSNVVSSWIDRTANGNIAVDLYSVTSANITGNLTFVTVGENGVAYKSADGNAVIWTALTTATTNNLVDITVGANVFLATGANSTVLSLPFANTTWNNVSVPSRMIGSANFLYDDPNSNVTLNSNIVPQANSTATIGTTNNRFTAGYFTNAVANIGTISNLQVGNIANLGNISNVYILGGDNGYFLQTDGTGNLTWAPAGNGGGGNGSPGGANSQVQFNDAGNFGGDPGFTYNKVTNTLTANTVNVFNLTSTNNVTSNTINVLGNFTAANSSLGNLATANYINVVWDVTANVVYSNYVYGDGSNLTNLPPVANANYASYANIANSSNTANIANISNVAYSVDGANVVGDVAAANTANIANISNIAYSVSGANVSGAVANATYAMFSGIAYSVSGANVSGAVANANYANIAGTAYSVNAANISGTVANANYASYSNLATLANTANVANVAYSIDGANVSGTVANANYSTYAGQAFSVNGANVVGNVEFANYAYHVDVEPTTNNYSYHVVLVQNPGDNHLQIDGDDQLQYNPAEGVLTSYRLDANLVLANLHYSYGYEGSNIVGSVPNANVALTANTVTNAAQPNITSVGNLTNLVVDGGIFTSNATIQGNGTANNFNISNNLVVGNQLILNLNSNITSYGLVNFDDATNVVLGEIEKISIFGGSNGYFLQTDGTGNLTWAAASNGGGGNTPPAGSNQQVQFNNAGNFGASANFTYDTSTDFLTLIGGINTNAISVTGNIAVGNASLGNLAIANFFQGSGNRLSNLQASNITGTVANATFAANAAYANLAANATYANTANASEYANIANTANVANFATTATNANVANIANSTPNANFSNYANVANFVDTVINAAQPNITSVGTLTSLTVSGNITAGNLLGILANGNSNVRIPAANGNVNISAVGNANVVVITGTGVNIAGTLNSTGNANVANIVSNNATFTLVSGTLTTAAQPNITSVGNLTSLYIDGNLFAENSNVEGNTSLGNLIVENNANIGNVLHIDAGASLVSIGNVNFDDAPDINLGEVEKITIYGGSNNYYLRTDGAGNLSWAAVTANGGNGIPNGANTTVQFNDSNVFGGSNAFTFDKTSNTLTVNGHISGTTLGITGNIAVGNASLGTRATAGIFSGSGNQLSNLQAANINGAISNANYAAFAGIITTNAQPNITSVGTLSNLTVTANISGGNISVTGNSAASNLSITGNVTVGQSLTTNVNSNLVAYGNVNFANSPNITFGSTANLHIPGGINGYFLQTDGSGNLSWAAGGAGGNYPGGSNRAIQFNNNGNFAGSNAFSFNSATNNVSIDGNLIANTLTVGAGLFEFYRSNVYFVATNTITANQSLLAIPTTDLAGADFTIISNDTSANIRNIFKMSAIVLGNIVHYNETNTLVVNGNTGYFQIVYDTGNMVLQFSPQSSNYMIHKMMVTTFKNS